MMQLKEFDYKLPESQIAQKPLQQRDKARLMVVERKTKRIRHDYFYNVGKYLPKKSFLIANESKVIPARLLGKKVRSGGQVEIFILNKIKGTTSYQALLRPLSKIHNGDVVIFPRSKLVATIVDREQRIVKFNQDNLTEHLQKIGHVPLPPYIRRNDLLLDRIYYQTVYAKRDGSVAAPTAGLHFTKELLGDLKKDGHVLDSVVLHINYATFKPVETNDITKHKMHYEEYSVRKKAWDRLKKAKEKGRSIVAIGTTSVRVLEAVASSQQLRGHTNLFIYPGFSFRITDCLITNFHQPLSTLLMLVSAFGSQQLIQHAYQAAIKKGYRFFSYGDAMLIL